MRRVTGILFVVASVMNGAFHTALSAQPAPPPPPTGPVPVPARPRGEIVVDVVEVPQPPATPELWDPIETMELLEPAIPPFPPVVVDELEMTLADLEVLKGQLQPVYIEKAEKQAGKPGTRGPKPGRPARPPVIKVGTCRDAEIDTPEESQSAYECARRALDNGNWEDALQRFTKVAAAKHGPRVAGAVYWLAYAQNKLGQRAEALATLGELKTAWPSSGWANEASALELEIRQSSGQRISPEAAADDELKLLALQGLANSDAEQAVPMIERLLKGPQPPRLKERALFVLAHSARPNARDVVLRVAKGGVNPDLQLKAIEYLGMFKTPESTKVLAEVYASTEDTAVRRAALRGFALAGDRDRLLAAARQESEPQLRLEAVRQLGALRAGAELGELYAREASPEVKKQILRGLATTGQSDKLAAVVQSETDPELKRTAIRNLGLKRDPAIASLLTSMYPKDPNPDVRRAIVDALHSQQDAPALVTLARQEKDPELRKAIVSRLSTMNAKEATDYMVELLK